MKTIRKNSEILHNSGVRNIVEGIQRIQEKINTYKQIAVEEIESMDRQEFIGKVCNGPLNYVNAKDGEFFYQCSFQNLIIFDQINSGFIAVEHPSIDVYVVSKIKFRVDCPFARSEICKLKNYKKSFIGNSAKDL